MKVSVLGCGTWGSAIAQSLADNGVVVQLGSDTKKNLKIWNLRVSIQSLRILNLIII